MEENIVIGVKKPGEQVEFVNTTGDLKELQRIVGGYIETFLFENGIRCWCNEEGKFLDLEEQINDQWLWQCEKLCCSQFQLNADWMDLNYKTSRIEKYYLIKKNGDTTGVRWNVLHGKRRKLFKFARKLVAKRVLKQYEIFNKYCGQEGILYIHARIGAGNWDYFGGPEIAKQPWFIEKVDDAFDCTYCDIYAKIENTGCKFSEMPEMDERSEE